MRYSGLCRRSAAWRPCEWVSSRSQSALPASQSSRSPSNTCAAGSLASAGDVTVLTQQRSSAPISCSRLPMASSRSGSAAMATLTPPRWKCPSSMASSNWLRWRRYLAGTGRPLRRARSVSRRSFGSSPVRRFSTSQGTPQRVCKASPASRICSPMAIVKAEAPAAQICSSVVPPSVVPRQSGGMWPSSEPEMSGITMASRPKASTISRSSSMSAGLRWQPGSRLICCARRGWPLGTRVLTMAVTACL